MKLLKYLLIIIFIYINISNPANGEIYDSLRLEKIKDKYYIVHRVDPKETLFSISKRYKANINDILESNSNLKNGLKMYQELFIPYFQTKNNTSISEKTNDSIHIVLQGETLYAISRKYSISIEDIKKINNLSDYNISFGDTIIINKNNNSKAKEKIIKPKVVENQKNDSLKYHIVVASETLYSIALKYSIDLQNLKQWNNLASNSLNIGQKLILKGVSNLPVQKKKISTKKPIDTLFVTTENNRFKTKIDKTNNIEKNIEEGFATKIDKTEDTKKYLALHRKAPVGTVIEVKNQMNNLSIFARVVGKLPETGLNKNVLIRLSHAAYTKLSALDAKIPVEIRFVIE